MAEIQDDLERLDRWEFSDGSPRRLISRRKDNASDDSRRKELVDKLHGKLAQYGMLITQGHGTRMFLIWTVDDALLRLQNVQAIKRPTERAQRNMYNLISNTQSLVKDEADWIREGPDLAALGQGNEHGWLNTFLEDVLNMMSRKVTMVSPPFPQPLNKRSDGHEALRIHSQPLHHSNREVGRLQQLGAEDQNRR